MEFDPITLAKIAGTGIGSLLVLAYPLMKLVRLWSSDRKENSKDGAESILYSHLSEQVESLASNLEKARAESTRLTGEVASLKARVISLEGFEEANLRLRKRLDEKDAEIHELTEKVDKLNKELRHVKERLSQYETSPVPLSLPNGLTNGD